MARNILLSLASTIACLAIVKIVLGFAVVPLDQQTEKQAKIEVESTEISIQYRAWEEVSLAEFRISNLGDKRLVVNAKQLTCPCYIGGESSLSIAPGCCEPLRLPLAMEALAYRPQINLMLVSNDRQRPSVPVCIHITDRPPLVPPGAVSVMQDVDSEVDSDLDVPAID